MEMNKISFAEMLSNNSGKTSGASAGGLFLILVAGCTFVYGCIIKNSEIISNSVMVLGMGSGLVLGKKIVDGRLPIGGDIAASDDSEEDVKPEAPEAAPVIQAAVPDPQEAPEVMPKAE